MTIEQTSILALNQSAAPLGDKADRALIFLIFAGIAGSLLYASSSHIVDPLLGAAAQHGWMAILLRPSLLWFSAAMLMLAVRTALWLNYRPFAPAAMEDAPSLTVVIPAYNEGAMVAKTVESVLAANYPKERLQILVIDDGSRDDTWAHIESVAARHPERVESIRFPENRGKRAALATGFRRASGEVVVTIDSDSIIEKNTLLAIAGPFRDAKIAAVGGKVSVFNRYDGLLPRMLHVRFTLSFDFLRSAQSTYRTVYCCPGALSAYRRAAVLQVLPKWENQMFCGAVCTIGEDRALTNEMLDQGYDAVYQRTAVVHTIVPHTYGKLCRMYLRWDRSYVREELRLARIVWKRPPLARLLTILEKTLTNLRYPITYLSLGMMAHTVWIDPWTIVRVLLSMGIASTFYMLYYLRSERSWDFLYGIAYAFYSFFTMLWIFPYALLTVRSRSWLTR